jgi:monoterpene epsilon-lactone hydrolase
MKSGSLALLALAAALAEPGLALAELEAGPRHVPAKVLAVPADVSPEMQEIIARPLNPDWNDQWKTGEEARLYADKQAAGVVKTIPALLERMHVKMKASTMDGVKVHVVTPDDVPGQNRNRVLVHVHGGCYVLFPGEAGTTEAIMMAGFGHFKVIAVDYRMPPEAYFPAALDDTMTVYKAVIKDINPKNVGVFGTSAGGALTLEMVLKAKQDGLPTPGAISSGTPMSDATKTGDSFYTNEKVDNVLVSPTDSATRPR